MPTPNLQTLKQLASTCGLTVEEDRHTTFYWIKDETGAYIQVGEPFKESLAFLKDFAYAFGISDDDQESK